MSRRVLVVLGVVIAVLVAGAVVSGLQVLGDRADQKGREAAARAAERQALALVSVSARTTDEDLEGLLDGATDAFRDDVEKYAGAFRKAVREGAVTATGSVSSSGVVSFTEDRARVLVAARGTVRNRTSKKAQPRSYRLQVDLERVSGRWLVSGLEFVA